MTINSDNFISKINALSLEIKNATSSKDITVGRRDCTRLLNQWKGMVRQLSGDDCYAIVSNSTNAADGSNCGYAFIDGSMVSTLFSIIDNDNEFSTEGHRETSLDTLKRIIDTAFCIGSNGNASGGAEKTRESGETIRLLSQLFEQCSTTFQKRMQRNSRSLDFHSSGGTAEAMESCEHIRLLLVELLLNVSSYLFERTNEIDEKDKMLFDSTSIVCQTLAKSALSDAYPDVQRASCSLIDNLAKFCPMAVRMNANNMLLPLTGHSDQSVSILKNSLFRHRHAKTRCNAVNASIAIVLCCPSESSFHLDECDKDDLGHIQRDQGDISSAQKTSIVGHGSKSTSFEQVLHDIVLSGWEELIKLDPLATVRMAVLEALGKAAGMLEWNLSQLNTHQIKDPNPATTFSSMDLASVLETKVLLLFFFGLSDGNAQVRALAVQQLSSFHEVKPNTVPWDILESYYQPVLELALDRCSSHGAVSCQGKVRCLEALQVVLSLTSTLSNDFAVETPDNPKEESGDHVPESMIGSVVSVLSDAILSDEKEVLEAALKSCRVIGGSDKLAGRILPHLSQLNGDQVSEDNGDETTPISEAAAAATPRQMASTLLFIDGLLKGYLSNHEMTSALQELDSLLPVTVPTWFCNPDAPTTICQTFARTAVTNNVATHSSLAWSLLDACSSFVQCAITSSEEKACDLSEENIVDILTSITYLLGCPAEYGISNHALNVLDAMSPSKYDDYFRQVCMKICSPAPFPWKRSTPAFLAIDALLRNTKGSTVRNNFDLVAPLFLYHLPEKKERAKLTQAEDNNSTSSASKEELEEEYSLRMALMAILQAILSDGSFSDSVSCQYDNSALACASSHLSTQFTFDVLLSLVIPNLVWKSGGLAAALRKLSIATLFALLSHQGAHLERLRKEIKDSPVSSRKLSGIDCETYSYLLPILRSNLDDTESTTRELSCACLSLIFSHMPGEIFQDLWSNETRVVDTLYPRLLALLDDSHNPVRLAACVTLERFLTIAFNSASLSSSALCSLGLSTLDNITESLVLTLDDPDCDIQTQSLHVLFVLTELVQGNNDEKAVAMIERHANNGTKSHRDGRHCHILLQKLHST